MAINENNYSNYIVRNSLTLIIGITGIDFYLSLKISEWLPEKEEIPYLQFISMKQKFHLKAAHAKD